MLESTMPVVACEKKARAPNAGFLINLLSACSGAGG